MLDSDDLQAVATLLKKLFQSNNRLAQASFARQQAEEQHAIAWRDFEAKRSALGVFGFNVADEALWDKVRATVGDDVWLSAQQRAMAADASDQSLDTSYPEIVPPGGLIDPADEQETPELAGVPSVREVVLAQLLAAGDEGITAAQIRRFYEKTYGRELHEKTIGMTLYRLSKDGKSKRFGRTWFITPSAEDGAKNPGASMPGNSNVFE